MDENLLKAYAEVDEILSHMESIYLEKIPIRVRELFKNERLVGYEPKVNVKIPLDKQNLQRKTLSILAMLSLNYWCENESEKKELIALYAENDKISEKELRERYNPDNLFKKKNETVDNRDIKQGNVQIIEYKEQSILRKILNKIIKFFKK